MYILGQLLHTPTSILVYSYITINNADKIKVNDIINNKIYFI